MSVSLQLAPFAYCLLLAPWLAFSLSLAAVYRLFSRVLRTVRSSELHANWREISKWYWGKDVEVTYIFDVVMK